MAHPAVTNAEMLPLLLTMKHVQGITGLGKARTYDLAHSQGFPLVRFGRSMRVPKDAFLHWLHEQAGKESGNGSDV